MIKMLVWCFDDEVEYGERGEVNLRSLRNELALREKRECSHRSGLGSWRGSNVTMSQVPG
jgi:hypothetical protein